MSSRNISRLVHALRTRGPRGLVAVLMVLGGLQQAVAQEKDPRPAAGLQDNSFLIEEAYNQEAGVVQHTMVLRRQNGAWSFAYTDEWPVRTQTHQFSYTVPYLWLNGDGGRGFGDVMLNYRYQALTESATLPAFAPRLSLILPTGDEDRGTGFGSYGYQINLPVSKIVSDRVTLHGNAGVTSYFDVHGRRPTSYNLGGSVVYAATRNTNFLVEALGEWTETVNDTFGIDREFAFTLLPGVRHAFNLKEGQLVLGAGVPIQFSEGHTDVGALFYFSFEHKFR
jgi:hypothetical protein